MWCMTSDASKVDPKWQPFGKNVILTESDYC